MRTKAETLSILLDTKLIAVIRVSHADTILPICTALMEGGIRALEITLTVPHALEAIRHARERLPASAVIGAGSVVDAGMCRGALDAGAEFIVSPILRPEIAVAARAADKPVMLGAYTPTEAQLALEAGSDFVKIFPADKLGPAYIKALLAPLPHLRLVPTGGVDLETAPEFLKAGCVALGVGSSLLKPELIKIADWKGLTRLAQAYVQTVK
ncbi:MAG: bifunctional 4-hydroxy-2-oxoglutarate aldolase/2-dehydro-3-deoxy-phosphogluconate aldolase [Verrucomicrobia subdivision 3 bacterium]|nr:bifunctional 4-hydroxy-2-oxoglutarate aldolase/2-dehydro-3-deoxy-phosphogluconate aldolase [Limisphaerales bacterium]